MTDTIVLPSTLRPIDELESRIVSMKAQFGAILFLMGEDLTSEPQDNIYTWISDLKAQAEKCQDLLSLI